MAIFFILLYATISAFKYGESNPASTA